MHRDLALFLKEVWTEVNKAGNVFQQINLANDKIKKTSQEQAASPGIQRREHVTSREPPKPAPKPATSIDSPGIKGGSAQWIHTAVYKVYNRFESTHAGIPQSAVPSWLQAASKIGAGVTKRTLQGNNGFSDFDEAYSRFAAGSADDEEIAALKGGFIHFKSLAAKGEATHRVYINVMPQAGLTLLRFIIDNLTRREAPEPGPELIVGGPPKKKSPLMVAVEREDAFAQKASLERAARQFSSCKIAGPLNLGKRSDGILVYCPSDDSARGVVKMLEGAQKAWFAPETPKLTSAVGPPGVGISIGAEPPQINTGIRGTAQQSFGSLRADLITGAVLEAEFSERLTTSPADFEIFCSRVELAFRGNGLDPNAPAYNLAAD